VNLKRKGCEVIDWIHLAQDGVQWWSHVNMSINFGVP